MKTIKVTMMVVVDNDLPADNLFHSVISQHLDDGEGIIDWYYEVIEQDTAPLDNIEIFNK